MPSRLLSSSRFTDLGIANPTNLLYGGVQGLQFLGNPAQFSSSRLLLEGTGLLLANPLPLRVIPNAGNCVVRVNTYGPEGLELEINGTGAAATERSSRLRALGGASTPVTLYLGSGLYPVVPRSRHRVSTTGRMGARRQGGVVEASSQGTLTLTLFVTQGQVTIRPEEAAKL